MTEEKKIEKDNQFYLDCHSWWSACVGGIGGTGEEHEEYRIGVSKIMGDGKYTIVEEKAVYTEPDFSKNPYVFKIYKDSQHRTVLGNERIKFCFLRCQS